MLNRRSDRCDRQSVGIGDSSLTHIFSVMRSIDVISERSPHIGDAIDQRLSNLIGRDRPRDFGERFLDFFRILRSHESRFWCRRDPGLRSEIRLLSPSRWRRRVRRRVENWFRSVSRLEQFRGFPRRRRSKLTPPRRFRSWQTRGSVTRVIRDRAGRLDRFESRHRSRRTSDRFLSISRLSTRGLRR